MGTVLGIDIGSAEIKSVLCDPGGAILREVRSPARAQALTTLLDGLNEICECGSGEARLRVAVTGAGRHLLSGAGCLLVNEVAAAALAARQAFPQARTVIDLGAQSSKWILLGNSGAGSSIVEDFGATGLCAAGAGAFLEQQASRLGLTVEELGRMAGAARRGAAIAGRCSVFAKTDMIHLQQTGTPLDEIAMGVCHAVARTFLSTAIPGRRIEPPLVLGGGGAANPGLVKAFRLQLNLTARELLTAEAPGFLGARGAALMARDAPVTSFRAFLSAVARTGAHRRVR